MRLFAVCMTVALCLLSHLALGDPPGKAELTPAFWQRDPEAHFPNEGKDYCAPTVISDGMIYLARVRDLPQILPSGDARADQIDLISDLAKDMNTDPESGTSPDQVLTGLRRCTRERACALERLELATWRRVSGTNRGYLKSRVPEMDWVRSCVADPSCVVAFNVGWYRSKGSVYARHGGHWIVAVASGEGETDFLVHNPIMREQEQLSHSAVHLVQLQDFPLEKGSLAGYYRVEGPGLPYGGRTKAAVLDGVLVFSLRPLADRP